MSVDPKLSPGGPENAARAHAEAPEAPAQTRRREGAMFLLLAIVVWPFIAVGVVAGWGLLVWIYHMFTGPPGPV
jgi:nitrate reductase NapE